MASKLVVFFDIDIILDVLQKRVPFYQASASLLAAAETGQIQGYQAAHSISTLFYLIQKDKSSATARSAITDLLQFLQVAELNHQTIEQALNLDYSDFEDVVQMMSAVHSGADFLVTRDIKDYQPCLVPVTQPINLLSTL
jgi:predicted nucleic acid-binding protein